MSSKDDKISKRKDIIFNYSGKHEMNFFKKAEIEWPRLSGSKPERHIAILEGFFFFFAF